MDGQGESVAKEKPAVDLGDGRFGMGVLKIVGAREAVTALDVHIPGNGAQKRDAPLVDNPIFVLRDPAGGENCRRLGGGELSGYPTDDGGLHAAHLLGQLRRVLPEVLGKLVGRIVGPAVEELRVVELFFHDDICYGQSHYAVGPRL